MDTEVQTQVAEEELSPVDRAMLAEYCKTWNLVRSWMATHPNAGYGSAAVSGSEWLKKPKIKAAVDAYLDGLYMSEQEAIQRISDIARGDIAEIMDVSSVGFNLDMATAKQKGLTKLIKKVKQRTTTYLAKKESEEDREETILEVELYSAHEALRDILKLKGRFSQRDHEYEIPPKSGEVRASVSTLMEMAMMIEQRIAAERDKARAVDAETIPP